MAMKFRIAGSRLDHSAVRAEITLQYGKRAFMIHGVGQRANNVFVEHLRFFQPFRQRFSGDIDGGGIKLVTELFHQCKDTTSVVEILHQIGRS